MAMSSDIRPSDCIQRLHLSRGLLLHRASLDSTLRVDKRRSEALFSLFGHLKWTLSGDKRQDLARQLRQHLRSCLGFVRYEDQLLAFWPRETLKQGGKTIAILECAIADGRAGRQAGRQTERQTETHAPTQTDRETDRHSDRQTDDGGKDKWDVCEVFI